MKKWAKISTLVGSGVLLAGAGAGIVAGIVIPKALEAKDALATVFTTGGDANYANWNKKEKINYIALGDSETAGFNMRMGKDYLSYADFLANDLNKAGKLATYKNYAVSGAKIPDLEKQFSQNPAAFETFKSADLITITIGANDLLSFTELFGLPFSSLVKGFNLSKNRLVRENSARETLFHTTPNDNEGMSTFDGYHSTQDGVATVAEVVHNLQNAETSDSLNMALDFNEIIKPKVFDLIKRNFALFMRDLHALAPNAQILILGHAMPFAQWDESALDTPRSDFQNRTVRDIFYAFLNAMQEGIKVTVDKDVNYAEFISLDRLNIYKSSVPARDDKNKKYTDYIKYGKLNNATHMKERTFETFVENAMPLAGDIHPSTFGHELMGNALFTRLASHLNIDSAKAESLYTFSKPFTPDNVVQPFERLDEDPTKNNYKESTDGTGVTINGKKYVIDSNFTLEKIMYDLTNRQGALWRFLKSMHGIDPLGLFEGLLTGPFADNLQTLFTSHIDPNLVQGVTGGVVTSTPSTPSAFSNVTDLLVNFVKHLNNPVITNVVNGIIIRDIFGKGLISRAMQNLLKVDKEVVKITDGINDVAELFKNATPTSVDFKKVADWQRGMSNKVLTREDANDSMKFFENWLNRLKGIDEHGQAITGFIPLTASQLSDFRMPITNGSVTPTNLDEYITKSKKILSDEFTYVLNKISTASSEDEKLYWSAWVGMSNQFHNHDNSDIIFAYDWKAEVHRQIMLNMNLSKLINSFLNG